MTAYCLELATPLQYFFTFFCAFEDQNSTIREEQRKSITFGFYGYFRKVRRYMQLIPGEVRSRFTLSRESNMGCHFKSSRNDLEGKLPIQG